MLDRTVRPLLASDWESVRRIYQEGIATGNATFETEAPEWERWDVTHRKDSRFVACVGESVVGWAALSPVSARKAYAGVAEVTVYVAEAARGSGTGSALLSALVHASETAGIWTLQAGIFSRRTPPLSPSTSATASGALASASASGCSTAAGETSSCSNAGAQRIADSRRQTADRKDLPPATCHLLP